MWNFSDIQKDGDVVTSQKVNLSGIPGLYVHVKKNFEDGVPI